MDNKNKWISDVVLNKTLKILGILLLFLAVLFMATQFNELWVKITGAISAVLVPVALAWLISLILYPIIKLLERRGVGPRWFSVAIVYIGAILLMFVLTMYLYPLVEAEIKSFFNDEIPILQLYFQTDFRTDFILGPDTFDWLANIINETDVIETTMSGVFDSLTNAIPSLLMQIGTLVLVLPILLLFYLLDYEGVNDSLRNIIPQRYEKSSSELGTRLNATVGAYIRGQLFLMIAIGVVATIAYKLIGLQYFFVFGIIVGLTNIIPYFGAILAMIPVVIFAIITKDGPNFILVVLVNLILQFVEGNIFQPLIMGKALKIHPMLIIVSILFFGSLFGTLGVILASPIAATIRVLLQFYNERREANEEKKSQAPPITHEA